jgi:outer membrane protein assembly factor BamB
MQSSFPKDEEIVITSIVDILDGLVMVGSAKNDNYRVLIAEMNKKGELEWKKNYGVHSMDYEGQNIAATKDGFLICGCSEGHASECGGRDWKAYLLKVSLSGEKQWERSFRIEGNECAFSLVVNENILLFGETRDSSGNCHFFLMNLDSHGEEIWRRTYCNEEDVMAGGIVPDDHGYILAGSLMRNGRWYLYLLKADTNGRKVWERFHEDALVYDMCSGGDGIFLTGTRDDHTLLVKIDEKGEIVWDRIYDTGCGVTIDCKDDRIMIAGKTEVGESSLPILYKISEDGSVEWKRVYDREGFIEKVKPLDDGYLLIRHGLIPKEHTEIIQVGDDGLQSMPSPSRK